MITIQGSPAPARPQPIGSTLDTTNRVLYFLSGVVMGGMAVALIVREMDTSARAKAIREGVRRDRQRLMSRAKTRKFR